MSLSVFVLTVGLASWYNLPGETTANGESMNPSAFTAAHRTLPFGTKVKVTYNDRSIVVRINDRGPYVDGRVIDLSPAAAAHLRMRDKGIAKVKLEVIDDS
jgi:rare lipoprotein A